MKQRSSRVIRTGIVLALLAGVPRLAEASPVTYVDSGLASGSLGSSAFTNALVTLEFVGDTANITNPQPGLYFNMPGTATVTVAGIGTATFTDPMAAFVNQNFIPPVSPFAGISDQSFPGGAVVLATSNSAFSSYALTAPFGPFTGPSAFEAAGPVAFPTTLGDFIILTTATSTFQAFSTIPEPSSIVSGGIAMGMGGVVCVLRSMRKSHRKLA
jgi:hypothetical protein